MADACRLRHPSATSESTQIPFNPYYLEQEKATSLDEGVPTSDSDPAGLRANILLPVLGDRDSLPGTGTSAAEEFPQRTPTQTLKAKKRQTSVTMKWLEDNYCACEGVCLPRGIVYEHYLDFCRRENLEPACKATFGKVIRTKFPHVTSKRLGARGHSKYHYHGIGIKENSEYYHTLYPSRGITRFSGCKMKNEGGFTRKYSLGSRTGTLLPDFPEVAALSLPDSLPEDKFQVFQTMYKTHCQCVLDTAITGNFEEIRSFLLHFWQGLPNHLLPLVRHHVVCDVIAICDWILCKTLIDVLVPATMQEMPETLLCGIRNLAHHWESWTLSSLENLPSGLAEAKLPVARLFAQSLKKQVCFLHLAQTTRPVLYDAQVVKSMTEDVDLVDLSSITCQAFYTAPSDGECDLQFNTEFLRDFKERLRRQATIENFIEWLDQVVEQKVIKPSQQNWKMVKRRAQDFLLRWTFFGVRIMHSMTLNNAGSFASFHLLRMLLDEYLMLTIQSQFEQEKEIELQATLQRHLKNSASSSHQLCKAPSSCFLVNHRQQQEQEQKEAAEKFLAERSKLHSRYPADGARQGRIAVVPPLESTRLPTPLPCVAMQSSHGRQHFANRTQFHVDRWQAYRENYGTQQVFNESTDHPLVAGYASGCSDAVHNALPQSVSYSHSGQDRNLVMAPLPYHSHPVAEGIPHQFRNSHASCVGSSQIPTDFTNHSERLFGNGEHHTSDFSQYGYSNDTYSKHPHEILGMTQYVPVFPPPDAVDHPYFSPIDCADVSQQFPQMDEKEKRHANDSSCLSAIPSDFSHAQQPVDPIRRENVFHQAHHHSIAYPVNCEVPPMGSTFMQ